MSGEGSGGPPDGRAVRHRAKLGRPVYPRVIPADTEDVRPVVADMLRAGIGSFIYAGDARGGARPARWPRGGSTGRGSPRRP
ncbi:hypothetical protein ACFYW8_01960 [Streptomyces sp. NPDC002742]|uniref:hypothetical protein n=1 Tax=Streptomyces sp. NPDC002742 TaxID=3364663 RepID=UPI00368C0533